MDEKDLTPDLELQDEEAEGVIGGGAWVLVDPLQDPRAYYTETADGATHSADSSRATDDGDETGKDRSRENAREDA